MPKDFPIMLASPNKDIDRINFPCIAQTKADGMRANIIVKNGTVEVFSRNGKVMNLFGQFDVFSHVFDFDFVLDGELLVKSNGQILDRQTGNGILHKSVVGTITKSEASKVCIVLWDIIPYKEWKLGKYSVGGLERLQMLKNLKPTNIHTIIDSRIVESLDEAQKLFKEKLSNGEEGIILKNLDHVWENKRSKQIVKMKEFSESDLKITGFVQGSGKASGMLGALECEDGDGKIKVDVGTGFTDEHRKDIWNRRNSLLYTIVAVKHNGVISRKDTNTKSLFLPVFVELRPDKSEADRF